MFLSSIKTLPPICLLKPESDEKSVSAGKLFQMLTIGYALSDE